MVSAALLMSVCRVRLDRGPNVSETARGPALHLSIAPSVPGSESVSNSPIGVTRSVCGVCNASCEEVTKRLSDASVSTHCSISSSPHGGARALVANMGERNPPFHFKGSSWFGLLALLNQGSLHATASGQAPAEETCGCVPARPERQSSGQMESLLVASTQEGTHDGANKRSELSIPTGVL